MATAEQTNNLPVTVSKTASEKFVAQIEKQFTAELGQGVSWTPLQKTLAQHLFVKIDQSMAALETKRAGSSYNAKNPPIKWENVNMHKLALDAVHRVNLELDALIPNHIHVIPYLNNRTQKYDLDLRVGYTGKDHLHRRFAADPPLDVVYQLVHETDSFSVVNEGGVQSVRFTQSNPFNPGQVVGGFGYIKYADERKNQVVIVEYREFEKAMKASKGTEFWGGDCPVYKDGKKTGTEYDEKFRKEMMFKTVVHRVTAKIRLDPAKVNGSSLEAIETDTVEFAILETDAEAAMLGNGDVVDVEPAAFDAVAEEPTVTAEGESYSGPTVRDDGQKSMDPGF